MRARLLSLVVMGVVLLPALGSAQDNRPSATSLEVRRLEELRGRIPERFSRIIQDKKIDLRRRLAHLRANDPPAYARMLDRLHAQQNRRLEWLQAHDPDEFREGVERRLAHIDERLTTLKATHPQRYEEVMARRRQWRAHALEQFRQRDPDLCALFLESYPEWRQALEPQAGHVPERPPEGDREAAPDRASTDRKRPAGPESQASKADQRWIEDTLQLFEAFNEEVPDDLLEERSDDTLAQGLQLLDESLLAGP